MPKPFLSVVVPSYNEQHNIERGVLDEVFAYLSKQKYTWEMVLTDDGSTDGTIEKLAEFAKSHDNVRLQKNPHRGKGPTVSSGMLNAQGEHRLYTDFDQSTPIREVEKLMPFIQEKYDIVIGSRALQGATREKEPWYRHLMGQGFNIVVQLLAVPGIHDTQCGFKMFSGAATEDIFPRLVIYKGGKLHDAFTGAFDVELLFIARRHNYHIAEVPVIWQHHETKRVSPIKDSYRMFRDIVRIRWASFQGVYRDSAK